jgi:glycosyltransferase involved in cell wall biosynthesis
MHIGFDAKRAFLNSSGLGNYSRTLISSLQHYFPENQYSLYTPKTAEDDFLQRMSSAANTKIRLPESFIDKKLRSRWRSYGITHMLREDKVDVYHGLSNELPFNISDFKGKKIATIHDLIFLRHPELYPYLDRKIYNKKFRHACDISDVVVAISEETKRDLEQHYFVPESKIRVIYQSCDERFRREMTEREIQAVLQKHQLPSEYILYVGTIEERKNLLTIVKALKEVPEIPLVVVGNRKSYFEKVKAYVDSNGLSARVHFPENVGNDDLPAIYRGAKIFVFPSFFEGFGIPIIEAMSCGVPVITSKGGCFPEAGGPDSIYVDPTSPAEMADAIRELLRSEQLRSSVAARGLQYVKRFHPELIVKQLMDLYTQ